MSIKKDRLIKKEIIFSIMAGVLYGIIAQLFARFSFLEKTYIVMSLSYLFFLPVVLGFISVNQAPQDKKRLVSTWLLRPSLVVLLCMVVSLIVGWEGSICVVMALPVYLPMAILGGVIAGLLDKHKNQAQLILLIPLCAAPIEVTYFDLPKEIRSVHTSITLEATPSEVWPEIIRVRSITEPQQGFFYKMGFPKPVEATLSFEGVGGVREAKFERGLTFYETIIEWEPQSKIRFMIKAHPNTVPLTTLDPHVVPGGLFFEALEGTYQIQPHPDNPQQVILHLSSQYRLSTQFNFYASLWGDWLMKDIQNNILDVLQQRIKSKQLNHSITESFNF